MNAASHASSSTIRIWAYDLEAPSFRHRLAWIAPHLEALGHSVFCETLPHGRYASRLFERKQDLRSTDLLVLSKIKLSTIETAVLKRFVNRTVFDFDDAIYYRKPRRLGEAPNRSWWRQSKFDATCRMADLVIAGNRTLAERADSATRRVEIIPTSVDMGKYQARRTAGDSGPTLVWIGLPENLGYLELIRPVLAELNSKHTRLRLRVVSSSFPRWPDVRIDEVQWSRETEAEALASADVGLMPLTNDAWSRGKCAFKLLQYMAAGLPCVASAVGANKEAVIPGETGFLAGSSAQWFEALDALISDGPLRNSMGSAGRKHIKEHYDRRAVAPHLVAALTSLLH